MTEAGLLAELLPAFGRGVRPAGLPKEALEAACAFANRVAAQVVTRYGEAAALPRREEI